MLLDYLDVEPPPIPALAATSPAIAWLEPSPAPRAEAEPVGQHPYEDMVLAHGPAVSLDDEPWLLRPLPAERIAAVLRGAGFTGLDERCFSLTRSTSTLTGWPRCRC